MASPPRPKPVRRMPKAAPTRLLKYLFMRMMELALLNPIPIPTYQTFRLVHVKTDMTELQKSRFSLHLLFKSSHFMLANHSPLEGEKNLL